MSATMQSLGIDRMTVEERLSLMREIRESIVAEGVELPSMEDAVEVTVDRSRELDRRLALMDAEPTAMRPWDEVQARLLCELKQ